MFRCHDDSSLLLHCVIYLLYQNPLAFTWHFLHSSVNNSWIFSHISAVTQDMPTNLINLCAKRHNEFLIVPQLVEKAIFDFYASCGSTHKIEFAQQIHNSRGAWPRPPSLAAMRQFTLCTSGIIQGTKNCARRARLFVKIRLKAWFQSSSLKAPLSRCFSHFFRRTYP